MTNTNNLLNQVESLINANLPELVHETSLSDLKLNFILKPVLFSHEKRGHMVCSALLNSILERNKASGLKNDNLAEAYKSIAKVTDRLNSLVKSTSESDKHSISHKLSHFTQKDGIISVFLESDQSTVEDFIEYTRDLVNSDEESSEKATDDAEHNYEDQTASDGEDVAEGEMTEPGFNDVGESIFKEIRITAINQYSASIAQSAPTTAATLLSTAQEGITVGLKDKVGSDEKPKNLWKSEVDILNLSKNDSSKSINDLIPNGIIHTNDLRKKSSEDAYPVSPFSDSGVPLDGMNEVSFSDLALSELKDVISQNKLDSYSSIDELKTAIKLVLNNDWECLETQTPTLQKCIFAKGLSNLMVLYSKSGHQTTVFKTVWCGHFEETGPRPTKQWLDSLCIVLDLEQLLL